MRRTNLVTHTHSAQITLFPDYCSNERPTRPLHLIRRSKSIQPTNQSVKCSTSTPTKSKQATFSQFLSFPKKKQAILTEKKNYPNVMNSLFIVS
jgi:hypothetical protein